MRETVDHGQVVTYDGGHPIETTKNGLRRVDLHSLCVDRAIVLSVPPTYHGI